MNTLRYLIWKFSLSRDEYATIRNILCGSALKFSLEMTSLSGLRRSVLSVSRVVTLSLSYIGTLSTGILRTVVVCSMICLYPIYR